MAVSRIERIEGGRVTGRAEKSKKGKGKGKYTCHPAGTNTGAYARYFDTLDEVAAFLRAAPGNAVRMDPEWVKISENVQIDGVPVR